MMPPRYGWVAVVDVWVGERAASVWILLWCKRLTKEGEHPEPFTPVLIHATASYRYQGRRPRVFLWRGDTPRPHVLRDLGKVAGGRSLSELTREPLPREADAARRIMARFVQPSKQLARVQS